MTTGVNFVGRSRLHTLTLPPRNIKYVRVEKKLDYRHEICTSLTLVVKLLSPTDTRQLRLRARERG